jgi:methylase of polypeptide subunit release factors
VGKALQISRYGLAALRLGLLLLHTLRPKVTYARVGGAHLYTLRGVFDPIPTISSSLLLELVERYARGVVLEVGAGTGMLSLAAARLARVARVYAVEVSPRAAANCRVNIRVNSASGRVLCFSSWRQLLERLRSAKVDTAILNPPYLPCSPRLEMEFSWCGGSGLEAVRALTRAACKLLKRDGRLLLAVSTIGLPGAGAIAELLAEACKGRTVEVLEAKRLWLPWGEEVIAIAVEGRAGRGAE